MQQAIYTNEQIARQSVEPGPASGRFRHLRLLMSVLGNVLGGAILLSGMLMLPELMVSLLVR